MAIDDARNDVGETSVGTPITLRSPFSRQRATVGGTDPSAAAYFRLTALGDLAEATQAVRLRTYPPVLESALQASRGATGSATCGRAVGRGRASAARQ